MTITVETGAVVANADSYLSVADADTYFSGHGSPTTWTGATTAEKEAALKYATRWLDSNYKWYSDIYSTSQVLGWPRVAYTDHDGRSVGGLSVMPQDLLDATAEMALEYLSNEFVSSTQGISRERIGSAEVQYSGGSSKRTYTYVAGLLINLGVKRGSNRRVRKG